MELYEIVAIISIILWIVLGSVVFYNMENKEIVMTWATTTGVMFLMMLSITLKVKSNDM